MFEKDKIPEPGRLRQKLGSAVIALVGDDRESMRTFIDQTANRLRIGIVKSNDESFFFLKDTHKGIVWVEQTNEFTELRISGALSDTQSFHLFSECDLVFVYGNSKDADASILFGSISQHEDIPNLIAVCGGSLRSGKLFFETDETESLSFFVADWAHQNALKTPLYGLVLAGGYSRRMQKDKGSLEYFDGMTQRQRGYQLLQPHCEKVYISCRKEQSRKMEHPYLEDRFLNMGPLGGILTAFSHEPNAAWLVMACDFPFLTEKSILHLCENRHPLRAATAFAQERTKDPEPLLAVWEPRSYRILTDAVARGNLSPLRVLRYADTHLLKPLGGDEMTNANTPEEFESARRRVLGM